jgi:hypothetical protein
MENHKFITNLKIKLSYWPKSMGRTCDEPHNILCNPEFDLQKCEKNKRSKEMAQNNEQISQKPSTSKQATMMTHLSSVTKNNHPPTHPSSNGNATSSQNGLNASSQMPTIVGGIRGDNQADLHSQLNLYEPDQDAKKHKVEYTN